MGEEGGGSDSLMEGGEIIFGFVSDRDGCLMSVERISGGRGLSAWDFKSFSGFDREGGGWGGCLLGGSDGREMIPSMDSLEEG